MLKITVDTNTLISATISKGNEFKLLRLAKLNKVKLILSLQILKEFKEVISRPKFGFSQEHVSITLRQIINICEIIAPLIKIDVIKADPPDNRILECAVSGKVNYIVSGDEHLLTLKKYNNISIIRTSDLLEIIQEDLSR